jgi:hypothetical protein
VAHALPFARATASGEEPVDANIVDRFVWGVEASWASSSPELAQEVADPHK